MGPVENRHGFVRPAEVDETAAVAQERVGVLRCDAELLPAAGGVGIAVRGGRYVAACFCESGGGRDQGVVGIGSAGLESGGEVVGDVEVIDRERRSDSAGRNTA